MRTLRFGLLALLVLAAGALPPAGAEESAAPAAEGQMPPVIRRFAADEDSLRSFYADQGRLDVYEKTRGLPLIYLLRLRRAP